MDIFYLNISSTFLTKSLVTFSNVCMISIRVCDSAERKDFIRICTVSSYDLPIILPNFSYMHPTQQIAALEKRHVCIIYILQNYLELIINKINSNPYSQFCG